MKTVIAALAVTIALAAAALPASADRAFGTSNQGPPVMTGK